MSTVAMVGGVALFYCYVFSSSIERALGGLKMPRLFIHDPFGHEHASELAKYEAERDEELAGIMTLSGAWVAYREIEQLVGLGATDCASRAKDALRKAALHAHDRCSLDATEILRVALSATAL